MKMEILKKCRRLKRADATKTVNRIDNTINALTEGEVFRYLCKLRDLRTKLEELNNKIFEKMFEAKSTASENEDEYDRCTEYDQSLLFTIAALEVKLSTNLASAKPIINKINIPQIALPEYGNNENEDLAKFFNNFEQIIGKYNLSDYEKFVYLSNQLSNEPLTLIKSLEATKQNYVTAKELLQQAFASTVTQQYHAIQRLTKLNFSSDDDPYQFVSNMRLVIESVNTLEINADIFLQFFIWRALNTEMKTHFINITNKNQPSLKELESNIFKAIERYQNLYKKDKLKQDRKSGSRQLAHSTHQTASAAVVGSKPKSKIDGTLHCLLCSSKDSKVTGHSIVTCEKYSDPQLKLNRLRELRGCCKCGKINRETNRCRFKFKRKCYKCTQYRFSYLCLKSKPQTTKDGKVNVSSQNQSETLVQNGSGYVGEIYIDQFGEGAILPTFSKRFPNNSVIRGMRDSGCQPKFITQEAADRLKLKVIDSKFSLSVHEFNASQRYKTDGVEMQYEPGKVPIKLFAFLQSRPS